jgi:hypothetical protein
MCWLVGGLFPLQDPVFANPQEVNLEEYQIQDVGHKTCPLHLVLERIVATPSGTVLACWQVRAGAACASALVSGLCSSRCSEP